MMQHLKVGSRIEAQQSVKKHVGCDGFVRDQFWDTVYIYIFKTLFAPRKMSFLLKFADL